MSNYLGNYSLYVALIASVYLIFKSYLDANSENKYLDKNFILITSIQTIMITVSFFSLVAAFVISDFSNETVFNNSHTLKPLFYKVSGTWGNHEGSLLLWLLILTFCAFFYFLKSKNRPLDERLLTIMFQELIIIGFLFFLLKAYYQF